MCTAITYQTKDFYFGRNLDLEYSYLEEVAILPRRYALPFGANGGPRRFALIGMAYIQKGYPLFYDACNEKGLCMAGLNFPGNAHYAPVDAGRQNVAPYELIPFLLGRCGTVGEARELLKEINLAAIPFSEELPLTPLHYMIAGRDGAIVAEPTADGLKIYDDPVGVLTNNPPFPSQMERLADHMALAPETPVNRFEGIELRPYSRGMGAMGLPGDFSSASRFVRAAYVRAHSLSGEGEEESVNQFFHILSAAEQPRGSVKVGDRYELTVYSSCCNADKGIYYYKTYENSRIHGVDMRKADPDGDELLRFPLVLHEAFDICNETQSAGTKEGRR